MACPEEIAYCSGWISASDVEPLASPLKKNAYGQYLLGICAIVYFNCGALNAALPAQTIRVG